MGFAEWLNKELDKRGWSQSEAARRGEISSQMVNAVVNGHANPGPGFCRGVSRAFQVPLDDVFRLAGILPSRPGHDHRSPLRPEDVEGRLVAAWRGLSEDDQARVLDLAERLAGRVQPRIIGDPAES